MINKVADSDLPPVLQFIRDNPSSVVVPSTAAIGAHFANKKNKPIANALRGSLVGASVGAGALTGYNLGNSISDADGAGFGGGALGSLLAYIAAQKLIANTDENTDKRKYAEAPLAGLLRAKQLSDRREYKGKHAKLYELLNKHPRDFIIDSVNGNIIGLTHTPTNFRIHAPSHVLPASFIEAQNGNTNI